MNLTHISPDDVIAATAERYRQMKMNPDTTYGPRTELSRQIQALAEVLTTQVNDALLEIENASDS